MNLRLCAACGPLPGKSCHVFVHPTAYAGSESEAAHSIVAGHGSPTEFLDSFCHLPRAVVTHLLGAGHHCLEASRNIPCYAACLSHESQEGTPRAVHPELHHPLHLTIRPPPLGSSCTHASWLRVVIVDSVLQILSKCNPSPPLAGPVLPWPSYVVT